MCYFPGPCSHSKNKIKAEFGVYNYTTIFDFTIETAVDTSDFAKKADLASINQILIN